MLIHTIFTDFQVNKIIIDPKELIGTDEQRGTRPRELYMTELRSELATYSTVLKRNAAGEDLSTLLKDLSLDPTPNSFESVTEKKDVEKQKKDIRRKVADIKIELARKFAMPVACLIMALLAMPLGIQPARSQNSLGSTLSVLLRHDYCSALLCNSISSANAS